MNTCKPLFIKGNCHSIPLEELELAFNNACSIILDNNINTIVWDGDPLTLIDTANGKDYPVKSFTLILPRLYEWALSNDINLRFIYGKKEKSVVNILKGAENEYDKHGTYYGPYDFLDKENTDIIFYDNYYPVAVGKKFIRGQNMGVAFDNSLKWNMLGITLMKWFKDNGANDAYLFIVGMGDVVRSELDYLSNIQDEVPDLTLHVLEFQRDSVP
jgi:hypothetical protein